MVTAEQFTEMAKEAIIAVGQKWEDLNPEQQELTVALAIQTYYEENPEEAKEILEGED